MIRRPRRHEIKLLPQVENADDERYRRVGLGRVVAMPPASLDSLEAGWREDRLWVAVSRFNRPVGFALMKVLGGTAWLDQLSVFDRWQGHGFGAALIDRTAAAARARGFDTLYLSTYRATCRGTRRSMPGADSRKSRAPTGRTRSAFNSWPRTIRRGGARS